MKLEAHQHMHRGACIVLAAATLSLAACVQPAAMPAAGAPAGAPRPGAAAAEATTGGELRIELGRHSQPVTAIASDSRGHWVATVSEDKTLRIWALPSQALVRTIRPPVGPGLSGALHAVAMAPDGARVAVSGMTRLAAGGHAVFVFERESGRLLRRLVAPEPVRQLA